MKYWFDKSATKNNIVILSTKALVIASADEASQEQIEAQLNANTHPKTIFGAGGYQIIPFAAITDFSSSSVDGDLEINYKTTKHLARTKISFDHAKSKLECMGYIKKLTLKNSVKSETKETVRDTTKEADPQEKNTSEVPSSGQFTVKSADDVESKSRLAFNLNFRAMLFPALGLILSVVSAFLLYPKLHYIAFAVGGIGALASLYFLYRGFKNSTEDNDLDNDTNDADVVVVEKSSLSKLSNKIFGVLKPAYLFGIAALAFSSVYFLVPSEVRGPASLYQAIQIHQVSGTSGNPIQVFLDNGADINYMEKDGTTPLITALNFNEEALAIELIEKGAILSTQYVGQTPLDLAIEASLDKVVSTMLNKEMVTSNPQDLLMRSISSGLNFENILLIADSGMDMNHTDEEGLTALGIALLFGAEPKVVKLLLDRGASTKIKIGEVSPLEFARLRGFKEISEILEQHSS